MNIPALRAWWSQRQGLDGSLRSATAAEVLHRSGWARSVAGVGPYLTLFSRARISRADADAAVAALDIHELPSARGCTYVVPAADFALALKLSQPAVEPELNTARKLGVTDAEIDKLCDAVLKAVGQTPLEPDAIRDVVGPAARSLGEAGKKKGLTTTLPLAFGKLQSLGELRRVPINGRLDQQRYKYVRWTPNPLAKSRLSAEEALTELARRYFTWIGPATVAEFQWFSGVSGKAAKAAIASLNLASIEDRLIHPADLDAFQSFQPPKKPQYELASSLDAISLLRRDVKLLADEADQASPLFALSDARAGTSLMDLPNHAILDRGRLVGLWEFDPATGKIVWASFTKPDAALKAAVAETEAFIRDQCGDARSFSLDSPKSRAPKLDKLRALEK